MTLPLAHRSSLSSVLWQERLLEAPISTLSCSFIYISDCPDDVLVG